MKRQGFTLIELLVVIVIIGILATISVATFSGYFAKARDTERQSAVRNAATILKTRFATADITDFAAITVASVATELSNGGSFAMPTNAADDYYYYSSAADEFVIFTCAEEGGAANTNAQNIFRDGTAGDVATLDGETTMSCAAGVLTNGAGTVGAAVGTDSAGSFAFGA